MWGPGIVKNPGRVSDEVLTAMDFLPSFAALAGINGRNRKEQLMAKTPPLSSPVSPAPNRPWPHFYYYFGTELHAVRENQYKLRAQNILHNEDIYRRDEFTSAPVPAALYDLSQDLGEQKSDSERSPGDTEAPGNPLGPGAPNVGRHPHRRQRPREPAPRVFRTPGGSEK